MKSSFTRIAVPLGASLLLASPLAWAKSFARSLKTVDSIRASTAARHQKHSRIKYKAQKYIYSHTLLYRPSEKSPDKGSVCISYRTSAVPAKFGDTTWTVTVTMNGDSSAAAIPMQGMQDKAYHFCSVENIAMIELATLFLQDESGKVVEAGRWEKVNPTSEEQGAEMDRIHGSLSNGDLKSDFDQLLKTTNRKKRK